jgi:uridine phosphorylase
MSHVDDNKPVLTAKEFLAYRRASGALPRFDPPRVVIFAPQKSLARYVLRRHPTKQIKGFMGEFYLLRRTHGQIALSTGFGLGAPVVAGLADEFAALGIKQCVLVGMAGGLQPNLQTGSLVVSTEALRGEGASHHYLPPAPTIKPSPELSRGIGEILRLEYHNHTLGPTWTTDAPFRELRRDVVRHQQEGVLAVDMEAAALFAVAEANGIAAAAVFSISDTIVNGRWKMDADLRPAQKGLSTLFDATLTYLTLEM